MATLERVQKVLANAGFGSRREIEEWIRQGRVLINGKLAQLGDRVSSSDQLKIDGRPVGEKRLQQHAAHIIMYNKPEGEIVTRHDEARRKTVFQNLPKLEHGRWIAIGRLDINSAGLMLFTTNGELANRLMHPSSLIEREYAVRVNGDVTEDMLKQLVNGVELDDGQARFEDIVKSEGSGRNRWFHIVIMEGRNREVRRMWDAVGARVNRLKRVRFGPVILNSSVKSGKWRSLQKEEVRALLQVAGIAKLKVAPVMEQRDKHHSKHRKKVIKAWNTRK